ncbi:MAG: hypothetical protein ACTS41_01130 [Candidatus Hodgkinia cicadicola]
MIWRLTYVNNCRLQVNIAAIDGTMERLASPNGEPPVRLSTEGNGAWKRKGCCSLHMGVELCESWMQGAMVCHV